MTKRSKKQKKFIYQKDKSNLSNKTVVIFLVLIIIVSIISLVWYLVALNSAGTGLEVSKDSVGTNSLTDQESSQLSTPVSSDAKVGVTIIVPEK